MKCFRLAFTVLVLLSVANSARAQGYISWSKGFPAAGTTTGFKVNGLVSPGALTPGNVTLSFWASNAKNNGTLVTTVTIKAADLTNNNNGTYTFALDNIAVPQSGVAYNITATAALILGCVPFGGASTQPVVQTSK